uniref:Cellular communication network factor 1, like 2 n=1 Tax=Pygocentrus nattereri TaxID=42514 RepID=A0AAR2LF69_PYGNA
IDGLNLSFYLPVPLSQAQGACPLKCSCPSTPPSCPPGISSVLDSCGCCRQCARQFNQDCSLTEPCDHIKGLRCHLGAGGDPQRGLCRGKEAQGRPCELDGQVYQHGEDFQPSCQHHCNCMDGVVGCIPLCPHHIPLPGWHCSRPRLTTVPGRCCQEWVCDDDNQHPDLREWITSSQSHALSPSTCFLQITDWSPCSATCGMGVSSRVTNSNVECRLMKESRLCQIRECGGTPALTPKKGKKCQRTVRPHKPVPITFAGCSTFRHYRPRSCGSCVDGRCCIPSLTRTVRLRFYCPQGDGFTRNFMWIQQCSCGQNCSSRLLAWHPESLILPNDIHTFSH